MGESIGNTPNNRVLSFELLFPIVENADLFLREAIEGWGDIFVVLAHLGESSAGVFAGEHGVGSSGTVEGFAGGDVEDSALESHVDGF